MSDRIRCCVYALVENGQTEVKPGTMHYKRVVAAAKAAEAVLNDNDIEGE